MRAGFKVKNSSFAGDKNTKENRRKFTNKFKAMVALAAISEQKTLAELSKEFEVSPNQVWSIDITYVPMAHGHMYLVAIIDRVHPPHPVVEAGQHLGRIGVC